MHLVNDVCFYLISLFDVSKSKLHPHSDNNNLVSKKLRRSRFLNDLVQIFAAVSSLQLMHIISRFCSEVRIRFARAAMMGKRFCTSDLTPNSPRANVF